MRIEEKEEKRVGGRDTLVPEDGKDVSGDVL